MAGAVARVEQKIIITGADNASAAVKAAQKSLGGLRKEAGKTKKATKDLAKAPTFDAAKLQQGTQRAGGALAALSAAMGPTAGGLAEVGKEATAFGSTAAVLPGPIGLAVAAVAGLAAGTYLLGKAISESAAKMRLLGSVDTAALKADLDLATDGAIKLSGAITDLKDKALRPSNDLIKQVIKNAESMGKDGADAAAAFVRALQGGPEALAKFQQEFGKLGGALSSLPDLATSLGLSADSLGLSKNISAEAAKQAEIAQGLLRVQASRLELAKAEKDETHAASVAAETRSRFTQLVAEADARKAAKKTEEIRRQIDAERRLLALIEQEAEASARAAAARATIAARADVLEARAAATRDKGNASRLRGEAATARQLAAVKALNAFDQLHGQTLTANLRTERASLEVRALQAAAAAQALKDARKAGRVAAAQRAKAAASAARELAFKVAVAKADRDGIRTEQERIELLDKAQAKEVATAKAIPNAKVRTQTLLAIEEVYQTKRAALERQIQTEKGKASTENLKVLNDDTKRRAEAAAKRLAIKKKLADDEAKINDQLKAMDIDSFKRAGDALAAVGAAFASSGAASGSIGAEQFGQSLSIAAKAAADLNKNMDNTPKAAAGVANALGGIGQVAVDAETQRTTKQLEAEKQRALATATTEEQRAAIVDDFEKRKAAAVEAGERRKAAILALMEVANAAASFPNIPLMVAHGAAAVLYGSIAGGLVGGGAPTPGAAGAGGGGFTAPTTAAATGGGGGGGAGQSITINFNQPLTTQQNIGKAVKGALNSISSTGHGAARGV